MTVKGKKKPKSQPATKTTKADASFGQDSI